jgi:hypothetical protein
MSDWQPIETAPRDGTRLILLCNGHPSLGRYIHREATTNGVRDEVHSFSGWVWAGGFLSHGKPEPTHWLPIPPVPASGIETEGHDPEEGHGAEHESPTSQSEGTPNPQGNPGPPGVRS